MFVDASALVAILSAETDAYSYSMRIDAADRLFTSPVAVYETVVALARIRDRAPSVLAEDVREFLIDAAIEIMPINSETGWIATEAYERYGKRSGHPARLNLGDCFAYAMARQHGVALLYKGGDFAQTDLA